MGQDFRECWASPWPVIGEAFERAAAGETSFLENQRMFLDRNGYLEETFFTFSFSPISDESGGVGGLFHPVNELTQQTLAERRLKILRDLAEETTEATTVQEACDLVAATMSKAPLDVPFFLIYLFNEAGTRAQLVASTGLARGTPASQEFVELNAPSSHDWPLQEALSGKISKVGELEQRVGSIVCEPYPEPVATAMVLPISVPGADHVFGAMIAGVSPRRPLDEAYGAFYNLLAKAVTGTVTTARAYEAERKRAEALAEMDRAKTAFFSNVSHEFRTPLTLMLGPLEDLLAKPDSSLAASDRYQLVMIHRNSLRLLKLVNTLLDFSRIEAGRIKAVFEPVDLAAFTAELASVFRSAMERAGLEYVVNCPPLPEPVYVDREMWEKIVFNLLSNALKFTFQGRIEVALAAQGDQVQLSVRDTGTGIPAYELPHVFERFHRVKGAKARTHEGTGIGLALVQELIKLHGGRVTVESQVDQGTEFKVVMQSGTKHLPLDRISTSRTDVTSGQHSGTFLEEALRWLPDAEAEGETLGSIIESPLLAGNPVRTAPAAKAERERILLADDNADMRDYVRRLLNERYVVTAVPDGAAALEAAVRQPPDLVLSDIMMPGLDGFGLLRELRGQERTRTIPVILLSARAGEESAVEGLEAGADDYLVKPFSARELLARIRTHLSLAKLRREWANELEATNKELEAFSYSVSHDLRAPLRSMEGFSRMLVEDYASNLPAEGQQWIARVRENAAQMDTLITGLLEFFKYSHQPLSKQTVDVSKMVRETYDELVKNHPGRTIEFGMTELPEALGDPVLLKQVFVNLLSNALKYSRQRQPAVIEAGSLRQNGQTVYFVRDNGAGFDMKYAEKLFGVFQRLHRKDEFEGTGVGLSLVQRIIQRHGGKVWAEAEVNQGATFYFTLN
jgi:signal transduction histidine kinase